MGFTLKVFFPIAVLFLLSSCQMPLSGTAKTANGLQLKFLIANAGSTGSATQAKLLLPTVSNLVVTLTSINDTKAAPINGSATIPQGLVQ